MKGALYFGISSWILIFFSLLGAVSGFVGIDDALAQATHAVDEVESRGIVSVALTELLQETEQAHAVQDEEFVFDRAEQTISFADLILSRHERMAHIEREFQILNVTDSNSTALLDSLAAAFIAEDFEGMQGDLDLADTIISEKQKPVVDHARGIAERLETRMLTYGYSTAWVDDQEELLSAAREDRDSSRILDIGNALDYAWQQSAEWESLAVLLDAPTASLTSSQENELRGDAEQFVQEGNWEALGLLIQEAEKRQSRKDALIDEIARMEEKAETVSETELQLELGELIAQADILRDQGNFADAEARLAAADELYEGYRSKDIWNVPRTRNAIPPWFVWVLRGLIWLCLAFLAAMVLFLRPLERIYYVWRLQNLMAKKEGLASAIRALQKAYFQERGISNEQYEVRLHHLEDCLIRMAEAYLVTKHALARSSTRKGEHLNQNEAGHSP